MNDCMPSLYVTSHCISIISKTISFIYLVDLTMNSPIVSSYSASHYMTTIISKSSFDYWVGLKMNDHTILLRFTWHCIRKVIRRSSFNHRVEQRVDGCIIWIYRISYYISTLTTRNLFGYWLHLTRLISYHPIMFFIMSYINTCHY